MFGHKSLPSRIYSYGAKPPADPDQAKRIVDQMHLAHRYRNALVELELKRRKRVDEILPTLSTDLAMVETCITEASNRIVLVRAQIKAARAHARKRIVAIQEQKDAIKADREALQFLWPLRKILRQELYGSPALDIVEVDHKEAAHKLRAECGLYWGTYLHVEQSMARCRSGAPPKFQRWNGDGHLAVQIQGGMSPDAAFLGVDTRIQIDPLPTDGSKAHQKRTIVRFRVDSDEHGGPIFAEIPTVLHRPLSPDAEIKWVHLIRRRIATHCEWRIQFVLSKENWDRLDSAEYGTIGIDVGWRMKPDGSMRVAYWADEGGQEGELVLPVKWMSQMRRTEKIQGYRDDDFNKIKAMLAGWLGDPDVAKGPDWLVEAKKTLAQWKSQARLAALVLRWREARFAGDEEMFLALEAWRRRDKHLYEFQGNLRHQLQGRREDIYRVFGAQIRRKYATIKIEKLDLGDFHVLAAPEETPDEKAVREHTRDACLSTLILCLNESVKHVVEVPAPDTTRKCDKCGTMNDWDRKELYRTCVGCGDQDDQDAIAARNILASGEVTSEAVPRTS